jgi:hypothetical protein
MRIVASQIAALILALLGCIAPSWAQEGGEPPASSGSPPAVAPAPAARPPVALAVLNFEVTDLASKASGQQIADALSAILAVEPSVRIVDRNQIEHTIKELELNLTGLVETNDAVRVGKLVGAKLLVTGRAFLLGESIMVTAKIIGTETSLVDGLLVRGKPGTPIDDLVGQMAERLLERLPQSTQRLLAAAPSEDPLAQLQRSLANRPKPRVTIWVTEQHVGAPQVAPDPAVQTELEHLLIGCGFTVVQLPGSASTAWFREGRFEVGKDWPAKLSETQVLIVGEAFSERAGSIGQLISCSARAEVKLLTRQNGEVVFSDRATTRQTDLGEQIAGRSALQQAGRTLGLRVLEYFDRTLPREPRPEAEIP